GRRRLSPLLQDIYPSFFTGTATDRGAWPDLFFRGGPRFLLRCRERPGAFATMIGRSCKTKHDPIGELHEIGMRTGGWLVIKTITVRRATPNNCPLNGRFDRGSGVAIAALEMAAGGVVLPDHALDGGSAPELAFDDGRGPRLWQETKTRCGFSVLWLGDPFRPRRGQFWSRGALPRSMDLRQDQAWVRDLSP